MESSPNQHLQKARGNSKTKFGYIDQNNEDHMMASDLAYKMNGADLVKTPKEGDDYVDSLHFKINQSMKNQPQILCLSSHHP